MVTKLRMKKKAVAKTSCRHEDARYLCPECGDFVDHRRVALGYRLCLWCGEDAAKAVKHTVANINKSAYMLITDTEILKQLNPKRTI